MANTYKNIVITPNKGSTSDDPKVVFSGANTSVNTDITLRVYPTSNGALSFEGSSGQLFSITNDLTGTIFSVNDISGIPSFEVTSTGNVTIAQYNGNVGIGRAASTYKLDVFGTINASNILVNGNVITATGGGTGSSSNTQVLFNDANTVNGSTSLVFYKGNNTLGVANVVVTGTSTYITANSITIGATEVNSVVLLTTTTSDQTIDSFANTAFRSAHYHITMNVGIDYQVSQISLVHNDSNAFMTEYGAISATANTLGVFSAIYSGTSVRLNVTPTFANTTFKMFRTATTI